MKQVRFRARFYLCCLICLLVTSNVSAEVEQLFAKDSVRSYWVFSGVVISEKGNEYGYFFQLQKNGSKYQAIATIIDAESNSLVFSEESNSTIEHPSPNEWRVGRAFLNFNPINNSWIFGFKLKDKKGFNFKVDTLKQFSMKPVMQSLIPGVSLFVSQTSNLNGHLQLGEPLNEQFVTAKNAWFRYFTQEKKQNKSHFISGSLCGLADGSSFYSVSVAEKDAVNASAAGWYDAQGASVDMSQFVHIAKEEDGFWHIRVPTPDSHIIFSKTVQQNEVTAGFISGDELKGFCMLSNTAIG